jgi:hypothetical protein
MAKPLAGRAGAAVAARRREEMIMTKLIAFASFALAAGCVARTPSIGFGASAGVPVGPPPPPAEEIVAVDPGPGSPPPSDAPDVVGSRAPGEDVHWFTADDYLVSKVPYRREKLSGLHVAKMLVAPSGDSKSEARFLVANGDEMWTANYWKTRPATSADLRLGQLALCNVGSYTYKANAPKTKHEARQDQWTLAAITDTSDTYKGRVTVGDVSCTIDGVRVPVR